MMVVDTSALMAVVLDEPEADRCIEALELEGALLISAGTLAEALIVADRRGVGEEMARLIDELAIEIVNLTAMSARRAAEAYRRWGKGIHPSGLNLGDCFAYEVAAERGCRLLFVGTDFSKTDLESAI